MWPRVSQVVIQTRGHQPQHLTEQQLLGRSAETFTGFARSSVMFREGVGLEFGPPGGVAIENLVSLFLLQVPDKWTRHQEPI